MCRPNWYIKKEKKKKTTILLSKTNGTMTKSNRNTLKFRDTGDWGDLKACSNTEKT